MARVGAMAYLAWRALVAHPLKRLRARGSGLERFRAAYVSEGLGPTTVEQREAGQAASACIACGLCETGCELAEATPQVRALGLHAAFRLYARNWTSLPLAAAALEACAGCAALCSTGVPIAGLIVYLRSRAGEPAILP